MPFNQSNQQSDKQSRVNANAENINAYYFHECSYPAYQTENSSNTSEFVQNECITLPPSGGSSYCQIYDNNYFGVQNPENSNIINPPMNIQNYNNSDLRIGNSQDVFIYENVVPPQYEYMQNNANTLPFINDMGSTMPQPPAVRNYSQVLIQNVPEPLNLYPMESALTNSTHYNAENMHYAHNLTSNRYLQQQPQVIPNVEMANHFINPNNPCCLPDQVIPDHWGTNALQNGFPNTFPSTNNNVVPVNVNNDVFPQGYTGQFYDDSSVYQNQPPQNYILVHIDSTADLLFFIENDTYFIRVIKNGQIFIARVPQHQFNILFEAYKRAHAPPQPPPPPLPPPPTYQARARRTTRINNRKNNQNSSIVQLNEQPVDLMDDTNNWEKLPNNSGYLCKICDRTYTRKYGLKIHLRTHSGHKPLECTFCGRRFGDPSNMAKHQRLHDDSKAKYVCPLCDRRLSRRRDFERHMKTRHPGVSLPPIQQ